jgi:DNA-binding transcriptional MerR regulator
MEYTVRKLGGMAGISTRTLGLEQIKEIMSSPFYDGTKALKEHHGQLLDKRKQLDTLIVNVEKTIALNEGRIITMTDKEKFEGFKQKMVEDNEKKYGKKAAELQNF